jgi:hypothetical protein
VSHAAKVQRNWRADFVTGQHFDKYRDAAYRTAQLIRRRIEQLAEQPGLGRPGRAGWPALANW